MDRAAQTVKVNVVHHNMTETTLQDSLRRHDETCSDLRAESEARSFHALSTASRSHKGLEHSAAKNGCLRTCEVYYTVL